MSGISVESWPNGSLITIAVAHIRGSALGFLTRHRSSQHDRRVTSSPAPIVSWRNQFWVVSTTSTGLRPSRRDFLRITGLHQLLHTKPEAARSQHCEIQHHDAGVGVLAEHVDPFSPVLRLMR